MGQHCNICGYIYKGMAGDCKCTNWGLPKGEKLPRDLQREFDEESVEVRLEKAGLFRRFEIKLIRWLAGI